MLSNKITIGDSLFYFFLKRFSKLPLIGSNFIIIIFLFKYF